MKSMYNDNTWRKSHRFGAYAIMIAGVVTIIMAAIVKNSFCAAMAAVGTVILASAVTLIYAHKVYVQEIDTFIEAVETKLYNIKQEKIPCDNVYQFLFGTMKVRLNLCSL